jgi:hypothetical protein
MPMSLDLIDHNELSLDFREFLSLGDEFPPLERRIRLGS